MKLAQKYILYLIRWQLSTPILAIVLNLLTNMSTLTATIIANFIGGLIFFWIDKFIFKQVINVPLWEIEDNKNCYDCNKKTRVYRIVHWAKYDKSDDKSPKFRCEKCSKRKYKEIKENIILKQKKNS